MKIARYGTLIVMIHGIVNGLHGLAHLKIPVPLSLLQSLFVGIIIFLIPIIAAVLLWTPLSLARFNGRITSFRDRQSPNCH
jgi:hypothetical protein